MINILNKIIEFLKPTEISCFARMILIDLESEESWNIEHAICNSYNIKLSFSKKDRVNYCLIFHKDSRNFHGINFTNNFSYTENYLISDSIMSLVRKLDILEKDRARKHNATVDLFKC